MYNQNAIVLLQIKTKKKIRLTIDGDCMRPVINNTDLVEISVFEEYHIGDIVLVLIQNRLRIHRIISKDSKGHITKGDHSNLPDKRIDSKILGKAIKNCTQNRSLCANRIHSFYRAAVSNICGKAYRKYLKTHIAFFRVFFIQIQKAGNYLLFHI